MDKIPEGFRELEPLPDDHVLIPYKPGLSYYVRRFFDNVGSDIDFCGNAYRAMVAKSGWRGVVAAVLRANKLLEVLFSIGLVAGVVWLWWAYLYPIVGKRWTAIIALSIVVLGLLVTVRIARIFHEQTVKGLEGEIASKERQKIEDDKALRFQRDQTETARQWQSELRSRLAFWDAISVTDRHEIERVIHTFNPEIHEYDINSDTPSIQFWFWVFNGSLYSIFIDPEIKGFIEYNGRRLKGEITTERPWLSEIFRGEIAGVRFRHWLKPDEVEPLRQLENAKRPRFNVRNLIVTVTAGPLHPEVHSRSLVLNFSEIAARRNDRQA